MSSSKFTYLLKCEVTIEKVIKSLIEKKQKSKERKNISKIALRKMSLFYTMNNINVDRSNIFSYVSKRKR